jgi:hypothetical protein
LQIPTPLFFHHAFNSVLLNIAYIRKMTALKPSIRFVLVIIIAHTIAYLIAGGLAYQFITKELWEGEHPLLSQYLRTPGNEDLWTFAMTWQIPAQLLRSVLIALALLPLQTHLKEWSFSRRLLFFSILLFVTTHLSSAAPSPANIEGLVYMRPEFIQSGFLKMQVEMILYSIIAGWIFAKYAYPKESKTL